MRYNHADGTTVFKYTDNERERALNVSLTSLASSLGYTPVRQGRHYSLKEMDSLVIYNDRSWHRWSGKGNITGGTQIDFLLEFGGIASIPEAIRYLLEFKGEPIEDIYVESNKEARTAEFKLPPRNENYRRLYAYLIKTRRLSEEVISLFVKKKLIYEDADHHNIVYCGYDPNGVIRYAGLRGTADGYGKSFKMDVPGNDKNYGVNIVNKDSSELKVFEAVIDCMSYIDMYGDNQSNKLVLGMVEDNPLAQFLKDYNHIKKIIFCLDNDKAAAKAIYGDPNDRNPERQKGLKRKYEELGYSVYVEKPPYGKDFNESLREINIPAEEKKNYIDAMKLRGYEYVDTGKNKIDFSKSGHMFNYGRWADVRKELLEVPLFESEHITAQVDQLISAAPEEKIKRIGNADIRKCISTMAMQGCTLLEPSEYDLLGINFYDLRRNKVYGFDAWEDVAMFLVEMQSKESELESVDQEQIATQSFPRSRGR